MTAHPRRGGQLSLNAFELECLLDFIDVGKRMLDVESIFDGMSNGVSRIGALEVSISKLQARLEHLRARRSKNEMGN